MNYLIGHTFAKLKRDITPGRSRHLSKGGLNTKFCLDSADKHILRSTSLPWEILESAYFFFQRKGYEKTKIQDICNRLNINSTQFYRHFESLDEVLEILWAR